MASEEVKKVSAPEKFEAPPVQQKRRRERRDRVPFGVSQPKMALSREDKEYFKQRGEVVRWVNDTPGRLDRAVDNDYRFVDSRELVGGHGLNVTEGGLGARKSMVVGTTDSGEPIMAYLMAKPKSFYEEDQQEKQGMIKRKEDSMLKGIDQGGAPGDKEGRYIPAAGISLKRE